MQYSNDHSQLLCQDLKKHKEAVCDLGLTIMTPCSRFVRWLPMKRLGDKVFRSLVAIWCLLFFPFSVSVTITICIIWYKYFKKSFACTLPFYLGNNVDEDWISNKQKTVSSFSWVLRLLLIYNITFRLTSSLHSKTKVHTIFQFQHLISWITSNLTHNLVTSRLSV